MILKYNTFTAKQGQAVPRISREYVRDAGGVRRGFIERWDVEGWLDEDTPQQLTTALAALEAALVDGHDLILYLPDGSTESSHALKTADCLGGVQVASGPDFDRNEGGEYVTYRSFRVAFEGFVEDESAEQIIEWEETVEISGGIQGRVFLQPLVGRPVEQTVATQTPYVMVQSGRALGRIPYPAANAPKFPSRVTDSSIRYRGPRRYARGVFSDYETSWTYVMTSADPISGTPTAWGS